jgi:hypothetical protein
MVPIRGQFISFEPKKLFMKNGIVALVLLVACSLSLLSQSSVIPRMDSVKVKEGTTWLRNPSAGGFNNPEFSPIDIDQDGRMDLLVYDRSGNKMLPFLNLGTSNQVDYTYAPEYESHFPQDEFHFAVCEDFDCDGKNDLFVGWKDGIKVYRNTSTPGNLSFAVYQDTLFTMRDTSQALLFLVMGDVPAFEDIDGDGDLDILAFDQAGNFVEWHQNQIMEHTGNCNGLELHMVDGCWGKFQESGLNQTINLGISCRLAPWVPTPPTRPDAHAGSTLAAFDEDNDGDYELLIGDLLYDGLTKIHNGGTAASALADTFDAIYPSYDAPVAINLFPAPFFMDVNNDEKEDLLAAPNANNISVNYDNSWYYENIDTAGGMMATRVKKTFLQDQMVDAGLCAFPAFFDYNSDGLLDIIVGNFSKKVTTSNVVSGLVLYENTGTATEPAFTLTNRNYAGLNTAFVPQVMGIAPAFGDLDGDGDLDLVLGDADGKLHYMENTALSGQAASFSALTFGYHGIDVGNNAIPFIVDIDRDGKNDLVVGSILGNLAYFRNIGTAQIADFAATPTDGNWGGVDVEPDCCTGFSAPYIFTNPSNGHYDLLVGSENGNLFYYKDFESELGGTFTLDQAAFGEIHEGGRTAVTGADITGDSVWEWVVGNVRGGLGFYSGNGIVTGVKESTPTQALTFELFPNPSTGHVQLRLPATATGQLTVTVLDLQGRAVWDQGGLSAAHSHELDLSKLPNGAYLVKLQRNGAFAGAKLIQIAH